MPHSTFFSRVLHIVVISPGKQMVRVAARPIIAVMTGKEPFRKRALRALQRKPIGAVKRFASATEYPIAAMVKAPRPFNAAIGCGSKLGIELAIRAAISERAVHMGYGGLAMPALAWKFFAHPSDNAERHY